MCFFFNVICLSFPIPNKSSTFFIPLLYRHSRFHCRSRVHYAHHCCSFLWLDASQSLANVTLTYCWPVDCDSCYDLPIVSRSLNDVFEIDFKSLLNCLFVVFLVGPRNSKCRLKNGRPTKIYNSQDFLKNK